MLCGTVSYDQKMGLYKATLLNLQNEDQSGKEYLALNSSDPKVHFLTHVFLLYLWILWFWQFQINHTNPQLSYPSFHFTPSLWALIYTLTHISSDFHHERRRSNQTKLMSIRQIAMTNQFYIKFIWVVSTKLILKCISLVARVHRFLCLLLSRNSIALLQD